MRERRIQILDPQVANKIAAGEVVERPAAVVKELVENALDAGATQIYVEIAQGGKKLMRITDNGSGMSPEDMAVAFERHATSKVRVIEDIYALETLGFRGEALASIAAVSQVEMTSKEPDAEMGHLLKISGGRMVEDQAIGAEQGTTIAVKELFFNTPARLKFMKSTAAETAAISDLMIRLALSHTQVSFTYVADQKIVFKTAGDGDLKKVIYAVLDRELAKSMLPVDVSGGQWQMKGYISKLSYTKGNRSQQIFFVNQRYIKSKHLLDAVQGAYLGQLPIGRFASAILFITLPPEQVDVNIHPAKTEVKFHNEFALKDEWLLALRQCIREIDQVPEIQSIKHEYQAPVNVEPTAKAPTPVEATLQIPTSIEAPVNVEAPVDIADPVTKYNASNPEPAPAQYEPVQPEPVQSKHFGQNLYKQQTNTASFKPELLAKLNLSDLSVQKAHEMPETIYEQTNLLETSDSLYDELIYIGQVFNSYLLFQKFGKLYVIDQHAGHEKILYERFKASFADEVAARQILAKPVLIHVNHAQLLYLQEAEKSLEDLGFSFETFGEDAIVVREVPLAFISSGTEAFFIDVVENAQRLKATAADLFKEKLITMACKAAIKANDVMDAFEVKQLVADLKLLKDPYTCPHGRPIIINITQNEFEKMFKRT